MENYYTVEITSMSAKDLKNVNLFSKMDVYAVLTADGDPCSMKITPVHYGGGTCPEWNHPLKFIINRNISAAQDNNICLRIQLKSKRSWLGDKDVGEVVVPVNALHDEYIMAGNTERSCQVRTTSRNAEGVLTFKFAVKKVDEPPYAGGLPPPPVVWSGPPWGPNPPQKKDSSRLRALVGLLKACYYGNNLFGNASEGFDVASAGFDAAADY